MTTAETFHAKLKWLIGLRVVVVTVFLGLSLALQTTPRGQGTYSLFSYLIVGTYLLTILYAVALKWVGSGWGFGALQIAGDLAVITVVTAATGGVESPFTFLYPLAIISGTMVLGRVGGLATLATAGLIYTALGWGRLNLGDWTAWWEQRHIFFPILLNVMAFSAVFLLSNHLVAAAATATKQLAERESGFRKLSAFHENVVQSLSSGLFTADLTGRVTSFNDAGYRILGLGRDEALGRPWWEIFGWDDGLDFHARLQRGALPNRFERETVVRVGGRLIVGMTMSWLKGPDEDTTGLIGIFQDLTEIKALEEKVRQRERLASVGELAAGLAHEIRNPLAAVSGTMQVLQHDLPLDEEQRTLMAIALRESERLNALIGQFLLYAKPASGQKHDCDLVVLIGETLALLKTHHDYREEVAIRAEIAIGTLWVRADASQMRQVIWNLVLNALQAMPQGGVLSARLRSIAGNPPESGVAEMVIGDTGQGILPEDLPRIFIPFFTTRNTGSGLGLAIVHRIVEEHRGHVEVASQRGKGTTVTITLPADVEAHGDDQDARDRTRSWRSVASPMRSPVSAWSPRV